MPKKKNGLLVLNDSLSAIARFLKYFGTSALTSVTTRSFFSSDSALTNELLIVCAVLAGSAGSVELLHARLKKSKKIAKIHQAFLKSERFLDFVMLFRLLDNTIYHVLESKYIAIGISAAITIPFAGWRAHKTVGLRYLTREPNLVALAQNLKSTKLSSFSLRQPTDSPISMQSFTEFKKTATDLERGRVTPLSDAEILRKYFNAQMSQRHFFNRYVLMDAISYGGEVAGIVGYTMYVIGNVLGFSNPMLNFGVSAFFFIAGSLVGYRIEKIKALSLSIYQSKFAEDQGLQDDIHELLVDLYAKVTTNVRRFAKVAEFIKNFLASFIGFSFAYTAIGNTNDVNDYYGLAVALLSILVGINSIYNVERQQQEMLKETGAYEVLEERRLSKQGQLTSAVKAEEVDEETAARGTLPIAVTPKKEDLLSSDDQRTVKKGSPDGSLESSNDSSASDSPPESRSLPVNTLIPIAPVATRSQSVADEEIRATKSHHKQGWGEWFKHTFFSNSSSTQRRELAQELLSPADRAGESQPVGATAGV